MVNVTTRNLVRQRADDRCEYCHLPQIAVDATFHVDHVIAQQHVDSAWDEVGGLALACDRCNFHKGTNLTSIDPTTHRIVPLFDPRIELWAEHFQFVDSIVVGLTPTGRATVRLLNMNARRRVEIRASLIELGIELA